jgi:hypothetical protein
VTKFIDAREPVITKSSDSMLSVEKGESIFLFCLADGLPSPSYKWLLNGDPVPDHWIEQTLDGIQLNILAADSSVHGGTYTCRFDNVAGTTEQSFNLEIL